MPAPGDPPCKYVVLFPFNVLSIAKVYSLLMHSLSICVWKMYGGPYLGLFVLPFIDLLAIAILLVSLWFTVQKFYWKKMEITFNLIGASLCSIALMRTLVASFDTPCSLATYLMFNHLFAAISWFFCVFWSFANTFNNVSNLFIAEWGRNTDDIEIEALENHF